MTTSGTCRAVENPPPYPIEYFQLQIDFADAVARMLPLALTQALYEFTNLYQILGLGWDKDPRDPVWNDFLVLAADGRAEECHAFYMARHKEVSVDTDPVHWGCFSYWWEPAQRAIHLRFFNRDMSAWGPLSGERRAARVSELRSMFSYISKNHPDAENVVGRSWLYGRDAYCRLFPDVYVASKMVVEPPYQTRALWGQFLVDDLSLDPVKVAHLRSSLGRLQEPDQIPDCFPERVFRVRGKIDTFYDLYGCPAAPTARLGAYGT